MVMPSGWKPLGIEMTLGPLPRCLPRLPLWPSPASAGTAMAPQSTSESAMRRRFMWFPLPGYMRGMSALDDLHEHIRAHTGCGFEICEGATNLVPGEGSETADVMVVGEAPGRNEDEQGRPFCGRAGALLDELLDAAGLMRAEVYVTNVVKARPPRNRDPTRAEVDEPAGDAVRRRRRDPRRARRAADPVSGVRLRAAGVG